MMQIDFDSISVQDKMKIIEGKNTVAMNSVMMPYLYALHKMKRCDEILEWLVDRELTGKQFLSWLKFYHGNDIQKAARVIIGELEKKGRRIVRSTQ